MKLWERILLWSYVLFWVLAPAIGIAVLKSRGIELPSDIRTVGIIIWYGLGLAQSWWANRNESSKSRYKRGPSYTDKGQHDWPQMD